MNLKDLFKEEVAMPNYLNKLEKSSKKMKHAMRKEKKHMYHNPSDSDN